jgi:hypothetical protein
LDIARHEFDHSSFWLGVVSTGPVVSLATGALDRDLYMLEVHLRVTGLLFDP